MEKMMKNYLLALLLGTMLLTINSCIEDDEEIYTGDWTERSDFDGIPRSDGVGFSIGKSGFIGTGYDGEDRLNDFWEYDSENDWWVQKADLPGPARNGAVGFSLDGKGYIGTGYDGDYKLNDFYEYDPDSNSWRKRADFPGSGRYGAVGFGLEGKGYIGTGYDDNYLKDFYEFSPETNEWKQIISIGGSKRRDATAFVIYDKAYVVSGLDNANYLSDFWAFDAASGTWEEKREITNSDDDNSYDDEYIDIARINGVAFSINGKGYLTLGSTSSVTSSTWEYDPVTDLWEPKTNFEGAGRTEAVAFGIGDYGYIATGRSGSYYLDDIWRFEPFANYDDEY